MNGKKTNALILAAGFSTRMGKQKHALKLRNGSTFLESLIRQYLDFGCDKIGVVLNAKGMKSAGLSNAFQNPCVKIIENPSPEAGRFLSIKLGLKALGVDCPVFMQNVDNPFAQREVLENLRLNLEGHDFARPVFADIGGHPVLLSPNIIMQVLKQPSVDLNFKHFLGSFHGEQVEVEDDRILINVNTPEEYERFLKRDENSKGVHH